MQGVAKVQLIARRSKLPSKRHRCCRDSCRHAAPAAELLTLDAQREGKKGGVGMQETAISPVFVCAGMQRVLCILQHGQPDPVHAEILATQSFTFHSRFLNNVLDF